METNLNHWSIYLSSFGLQSCRRNTGCWSLSVDNLYGFKIKFKLI